VFIEAKDDGDGADNWSYKSCKAPVKSSPPTNQHLAFFTGRMPFLSPNQQCQNTEGKKINLYVVDLQNKHSGKISGVESSGNVLEFSGNPATASLTVD